MLRSPRNWMMRRVWPCSVGMRGTTSTIQIADAAGATQCSRRTNFIRGSLADPSDPYLQLVVEQNLHIEHIQYRKERIRSCPLS